jgi:uncharacterized protein YbjT (DUF2867 family)
MVNSQRKILVTGAAGQQGGSLSRLLLQKKHKVCALTRNTQSYAAQALRNKGANIVRGDLDDSDSLGKLMADIAKENNIEHLVYSSVANADENTGIPHFESIKSSSILKILEFLILLLVPLFYGKLAWYWIRAGSVGFTFIFIDYFTTKCS